MFNQITNCNCERKCFDRVPKEIQERIYKGYNQLPNNNEKNLYLYGLICKTSEKSDQPNSRASYRYFVKVNGFQVDICQKAFINIHGTTPAKVRTLLHKLNKGVIYPNDRRGEARKLRRTGVGEAIEQDIIKHLTSVFQVDEVWDRMKKGEKINVTKLWEDYRTFHHDCEPSSNDGDEMGQTSANSRMVGKKTYAIIFKRVYPEIIEKLDDKNELPARLKKRKRKSNPTKKTSADFFRDENSELELESSTVSSRTVAHNLKPVQIVYLV